jgi:AGCS family alanine or glycine:cation symporter
MNPFLQAIDHGLVIYNDYVGGYLILLLLIPTGLFLIFRLKFLNVTMLRHTVRVVAGKFDRKGDSGDVNHFKALTTALSATVGTGNIVGVSLSIYLGGPGAVFWLWVTGFLGMIIKYSECTLSHKFRRFNSDGTVSGGPMYYMEHGLKDRLGKFAKIMALVFAFATILCSLGTGNMAQTNSMSDALMTNYSVPTWLSGIVITFLAFLIIVGGIKRIAEVTSFLVPFMAIFYILGVMIILVAEYDRILPTIAMIVSDAFTGTAATGGFVGSTFFATMIWGVRRGLFSNEAGQGSSPIAHAAAKTKYPAREGLVASLEPLVDTLIICTMTALVILLTGAWHSGIKGVGMTVLGMETGLNRVGISGLGGHIVAVGILLFAFSTVVSWNYYGTRAAIYLFGEKAVTPYNYVYTVFVFLGCIWGIDLVWHFVDAVITFMTIPNLIAVLLLTPVLMKETRHYLGVVKRMRKGEHID